MDTRVEPHIRIINGALDDEPDSPAGIILQGRIDPATFRFLRLDDRQYQRVQGDRPDIFEAIQSGKVPPAIEIGVRGQDFVTDGSDFIIRSPAYIVDGGGRIGTAKRLLELIPEKGIRLFAMIHFNTDSEWETERFNALSKNVRKISSSLHLRNMRAKSPAILSLFGLSDNTPTFPLYKRVCWLDNMSRGDLLRATVFAKIAISLHGKHAGFSNTTEGIAGSLARAADAVKLPVFRSNIATFFAVVNECWPFAAIEYRHAATQLKSQFLIELARMFAAHPAFWGGADDNVLTVLADDRRKLAKFPLDDPTVRSLAGSSGKARAILYRMLVDHMNSGRRTQRLVERAA